jgi:hypothetical protein
VVWKAESVPVYTGTSGRQETALRSINAFVVCAALLLAACAPHKSALKAENFPVVVPFAIDRAGSKVTVEFELPNALDLYFKERRN